MLHYGAPPQLTNERQGLAWLRYILGPSVGPLNLFLQGRPDLCDQPMRRTLDGLMGVRGFRALCATHCGGHANLVAPFFEPQIRAAAAAMRLDLSSLCHHYHGEFVADRAAVQGAIEHHGAVIRDLLVPELEQETDPPMGHALERLWVALFAPPVAATAPVVPKRIWILWEQGWHNAPYLQQQVLNSFPKSSISHTAAPSLVPLLRHHCVTFCDTMTP